MILYVVNKDSESEIRVGVKALYSKVSLTGKFSVNVCNNFNHPLKRYCKM
jgi:hypothetical protein